MIFATTPELFYTVSLEILLHFACAVESHPGCWRRPLLLAVWHEKTNCNYDWGSICSIYRLSMATLDPENHGSVKFSGKKSCFLKGGHPFFQWTVMIMGERVIPRFCLSTADSPPFFPPHFFHQAALVDLDGHAGHASHITTSHGPRWCFVSRMLIRKSNSRSLLGIQFTFTPLGGFYWYPFKKNSSKMGSSAPFVSVWFFFNVWSLTAENQPLDLQSLVVWNPIGSFMILMVRKNPKDPHESYGIRHPLELRKSPHVSFFTLEPK